MLGSLFVTQCVTDTRRVLDGYVVAFRDSDELDLVSVNLDQAASEHFL